MLKARTLGPTHVAKVSIQQLDISVQHFKAQQLIIPVVQTSTKIQTGIPATGEDKARLLQP